jgi:hypothetical protein
VAHYHPSPPGAHQASVSRRQEFLVNASDILRAAGRDALRISLALTRNSCPQDTEAQARIKYIACINKELLVRDNTGSALERASCSSREGPKSPRV